VINDDLIEGGKGFETHSHVNMEILTYLLRGRLEHKDSMGNGTIIRRDEIQIMSAGKGITHSEFNPDPAQITRLLQVRKNTPQFFSSSNISMAPFNFRPTRPLLHLFCPSFFFPVRIVAVCMCRPRASSYISSSRFWAV
jgi:hypothetical protein